MSENTAKQSRLGLFQDSDFAGVLADSKSTSGGTLCVFGSHTFVPISWMCKKRTSVLDSSTESEIISLDTGLRMDGIPSRTLSDLVIEIFHFVPKRTDGPKRESRGKPSAVVKPNVHNPIQIKHTNGSPTNFDHIQSNTSHSDCFALCQVIQMSLLDLDRALGSNASAGPAPPLTPSFLPSSSPVPSRPLPPHPLPLPPRHFLGDWNPWV